MRASCSHKGLTLMQSLWVVCWVATVKLLQPHIQHACCARSILQLSMFQRLGCAAVWWLQEQELKEYIAGQIDAAQKKAQANPFDVNQSNNTKKPRKGLFGRKLPGALHKASRSPRKNGSEMQMAVAAGVKEPGRLEDYSMQQQQQPHKARHNRQHLLPEVA